METNDTNATINNDQAQVASTNAADVAEQPTTPTTEELMARIAEAEAAKAKAEAERDTLKRSNDKLSKEAAEIKREKIANMTADEAAKAQAEEERKKMEEELAETKKQLNHINAVAAYKSVSDEKIVEQLIEAVSVADHASIAAIMEAEKQKAVKVAQAEWMKSRPPVSAGDGYSSMTKEQILAIADDTERRKAIAANLDLFQQSN